jgi:hypothetical protein
VKSPFIGGVPVDKGEQIATTWSLANGELLTLRQLAGEIYRLQHNHNMLMMVATGRRMIAGAIYEYALATGLRSHESPSRWITAGAGGWILAICRAVPRAGTLARSERNYCRIAGIWICDRKQKG